MGYQKREEQTILGNLGCVCRGLLGQGAFSRVYLAEGERDGRMYAGKISRDRELLEKEAALMEKLQHPLFPRYFGIWQEAGLGCLMMEYVPGSNLEEMLRRRKSFSVRQTVQIGMELAEGLLYLHESREGILFRDVKPANIIIRQDGQVRLLDFGCACTMSEGTASRAGTPGFAAPEQLAGKGGLAPQSRNVPFGHIDMPSRLTTSCDVYGLGQTLKAVLGISEYRVPAWENRQGWKKRENREDRKNRKQLGRILDACTRKEVSQRIPDMRGVMDAMAPLCDKGQRYFGRKHFFPGRDIACRKNIWESAYKNS